MEHRWSIRKAHQCSVLIDCPRSGPTRATLHNIGIGGMFVETGSVDLPANSAVNVAFALGGDDHREYFRLPAMVVRRTSKGAGIMFLESEVDSVRTLRRALYKATMTPEQIVSPSGAVVDVDIHTARASRKRVSHEAAVS